MRQATDEEKAKLLAAREKEAKEMRDAIDAVLSTDSGKKLWGYLCRVCGFNRSSLVLDFQKGDVRAEGTTYNEARREVYLRLRTFASPERLKEVEYLKENQ